jgi:hypothetical protein
MVAASSTIALALAFDGMKFEFKTINILNNGDDANNEIADLYLMQY